MEASNFWSAQGPGTAFTWFSALVLIFESHSLAKSVPKIEILI